MTPTTSEREALIAELRRLAMHHEVKGDRPRQDDKTRQWHMGASGAYDDAANRLAALTRREAQQEAQPLSMSMFATQADFDAAQAKQEAQGAVALSYAQLAEFARKTGYSVEEASGTIDLLNEAIGATPPAPVDVRAFRAALQQIADWKLPPTNQQWPSGNPVSYEAAFGSNGARDYMRQVAAEALALLDGQAAWMNG